MTPMQQILLGVGASKKTYLDDVFSTFLYDGTGSAQSINNGINLSSKGGMVWIKKRNNTGYSHIIDTSRGVGKSIHSDQDFAESATSNALTAFNSNGFSIGDHGGVNQNDYKIASWTFRKAKGFFDVVTWAGNETNRTISHSLGCVPGCIIIKCTDDNKDWTVYHRGIGAEKRLKLNSGDAPYDNSIYFQDTEPTSTSFSIGNSMDVNGVDAGTPLNYVAYVFAGGESTAATARSVDFDGDDDLRMNGSSDFAFGTGDFTWEAWIKPDSWSNTYHTIFCTSDTGGIFVGKSNSDFVFRVYGVQMELTYATMPPLGQWTHVAFAREGTNLRLFYNGTLVKTATSSYNFSVTSTYAYIGSDSQTAQAFYGEISNLRIVKGTAVYTTSFKPPTEPLTNITNTKLLCCNNSSVTGATVTPNTISIDHGDPTASTDSPFDDPAGFVFGDAGDQGIIKCGSYIGNGSTTGPEINLGFEPQFLIIKGNTDWHMVDSMRGIITKGNEPRLFPNGTGSEAGQDIVDLTPTGFKITAGSAWVNDDGVKLVYIAIRRPDGYVGKPAEAGTDVFGMTTGRGSGTLKPDYLSSFPVDFTIHRQIASTDNWHSSARLIQGYNQYPNKTDGQSTNSDYAFDYSDGWGKASWGSDRQSWMWKRHAGFDVVAYKGYEIPGVRAIPHNLGKVPEMVWLKARNYENYGDWYVYHKGLNGGTNPEQYHVLLNSNAAEVDSVAGWGDTAPTSTHFTVGNDNAGNGTYDYIAMLFASVDGISKVGSYTGNGTSDSSTQTITTGFQPRFVIIKSSSHGEHWVVFDTTRGWSSGSSDQLLELNNTDGQTTALGDLGHPISTGFVLEKDESVMNLNGHKYIYYAHA